MHVLDCSEYAKLRNTLPGTEDLQLKEMQLVLVGGRRSIECEYEPLFHTWRRYQHDDFLSQRNSNYIRYAS